jgi:hypothetical protein
MAVWITAASAALAQFREDNAATYFHLEEDGESTGRALRAPPYPAINTRFEEEPASDGAPGGWLPAGAKQMMCAPAVSG